MPWKEVSTMSLRQEFVVLAQAEAANVRALCRRFGISPKSGYKWLARYAAKGANGLAEQSRRPQTSPAKTSTAVETDVVAVRQEHPAWGGRKIRARLQALGQAAVPAASTITTILRRHGLIDPATASQHRPWQRFEQPRANELWQMDFKGHFALEDGRRCHPLTVLDDHSRFALGLRACRDEQGRTVEGQLRELFRHYGLPRRMLMDNGSPWGFDWDHPYTPLTVWLLRLGVGVTHGRPYHPQTQGKDERFHRTLAVEVLRGRSFRNHAECQRRFDAWRTTYNLERPHEALGLQPPATRYQPSPRAFPETLPVLEYGPDDVVRRVQQCGRFSYRGRDYTIATAFTGHAIALRPTGQDGELEVWFAQHCLGTLDQRSPEPGRVVRRGGQEGEIRRNSVRATPSLRCGESPPP